jgi:hypothetical protein
VFELTMPPISGGELDCGDEAIRINPQTLTSIEYLRK